MNAINYKSTVNPSEVLDAKEAGVEIESPPFYETVLDAASAFYCFTAMFVTIACNWWFYGELVRFRETYRTSESIGMFFLQSFAAMLILATAAVLPAVCSCLADLSRDARE